MCGICGYTGSKTAAPLLRKMLKIMEDYNLGYESTGMATIEDGKIALIKNVGKVNAVFPERGFWNRVLKGKIGIAHTRYPSKDAPIGEPQSAHPYLSCDGNLVLMHNGTIVNHKEICKRLGCHTFSSLDETTGKINDSEVIVHLLEEEISIRENDIVASVTNVCNLLAQNSKNIYLFAFIHRLHPSAIFVVSGSDYENKRKIVVATKRKFGTLFASYRDAGIKSSAINPFIDCKHDKTEILDYGVLAVLRKDNYETMKL